MIWLMSFYFDCFFVCLFTVVSHSSMLQYSIGKFHEFVKKKERNDFDKNKNIHNYDEQSEKLKLNGSSGTIIYQKFDASQCLILQRINHTIFNGLAFKTICFGASTSACGLVIFIFSIQFRLHTKELYF